MPEIADVLPNDPIADEWGNLIRDRTIQRYDDRATRTSEHDSPANGDLAYLEDEKVIEFYDGAAWVGFLPAGTIVMTGRTAAPAGWLLCQGQAVSRTTYATLFAAISTAFGVGDGATTFNLPDLRQRFPLGKADSGTGQTLGDTGGSINHVHSNPTTASGGSHAHSQGVTGSDGNHAHFNNHTHDYTTGTAGQHSHSFSDSFSTGGPSASGDVPFGGSSPRATSTHSHSGSVSGTTSSAGSHAHGGTTGNASSAVASAGEHAHGNPNTNSGGSHDHSQGNTGQGNPPYLVVNYMIKH